MNSGKSESDRRRTRAWQLADTLASSGRHLRISFSEISGGEEINQVLHGHIRFMIRPLDLRRLRGSILGPVMKQRVRQRAADPFVKQNEQCARLNPLLGESVRVRTADALQ